MTGTKRPGFVGPAQRVEAIARSRAARALRGVAFALLLASSGACVDESFRSCGTFTFDGRVIHDTQDPARAVGAAFKETFTFDPAKCGCSCNQVWFVQILRPKDVQTGEIIQPHAAQQGRMVIDPAHPELNGWAVDRLDGVKFGYYAMNDDGSVTEPSHTSRFGSATVSAVMQDQVGPGRSGPFTGRTMMVQGVTAAVCMDGDCKGRILGLEEWIVNFHDGTIDPATAHEGYKWEAEAVSAAIQQWNEHLDGRRVALPVYAL